MDDFVFLSWWLGNTWNFKSKFKFQVFPSRQDRKTKSSVCFLGEVNARQFCSEIYWPLVRIGLVELHPAYPIMASLLFAQPTIYVQKYLVAGYTKLKIEFLHYKAIQFTFYFKLEVYLGYSLYILIFSRLFPGFLFTHLSLRQSYIAWLSVCFPGNQVPWSGP